MLSSSSQITCHNLISLLSGLKTQRKPNDSNINAFYSAISSKIHVNPNEIFYLRDQIGQLVPKHKIKWLCRLESISIYNEIPFAQFIVDLYSEMVLKNNWTINQFMDNSHCLSNLPKDNKSWILVRQYLSNYVRYIHAPFNKNNFANMVSTNYDSDDDYDDDCDGDDNDVKLSSSMHNMKKVLKYITNIHQVVTYSKTQQIDVIFAPNPSNNINSAYFEKLNIKYVHKQMSYNKTEDDINILQLFRAFTDCLDCLCKARLFQRSIILIIANNNTDIDDIYMFKPLYNNILPKAFCDYSELAWIINSKSTLPGNVFNISFHIHRHKHSTIERVYFLNESCGVRLFKRNIIDILSPFCSNCISSFEWTSLCGIEFKDDKYFKFKNDLFPEFIDISSNELNEIKQWCDDNEFNDIHEIITDIEFPEESSLVEAFSNIFSNI